MTTCGAGILYIAGSFAQIPMQAETTELYPGMVRHEKDKM